MTLEVVLYLLDLWDLGSEARRSPVHVSRCLANMVHYCLILHLFDKWNDQYLLSFCSQVNRNDSDGGILVGLWSSNEEDYADGTEPTAWSGSEAILQEYMKRKRPVKYAQCWVFGGTLTTSEMRLSYCIYFSISLYLLIVSGISYNILFSFSLALRTIGIPARPITNFESAHDADYNRAIDYYIDKNGSFIDEKSADSVWLVNYFYL